MKQALHKISDVAKFLGISTATLRYYESYGLVKPDKISEETGYRYYSADNVSRISYVVTLRESGMSMQRIKDYIGGSLSLDGLIDELTRQRNTIDRLIKLNCAQRGKFDVFYMEVPRLDCVSKHIVAADVGDMFVKFMDYMNETVSAGIAIGHEYMSMAVFPTTEPQMENFDADICFIKSKNQLKNGSERAISLLYRGEYENINEGYDALKSFAASNGLILKGRAMEIYHESYNFFNRSEPEMFLTQIIFPVERYSAVLFDLDGTLLNTLDDLTDSVNFALDSIGEPERTRAEVRGFVGNGIRKLMSRAVNGGENNPKFNEAYDAFKRHYMRHCTDKTAPYDGIIELLTALKTKGIKVGVVSNKADAAAKAIVSNYFGALVDITVGELDGVERKPSPAMLNGALRELGVSKANAVYVGDGTVDIVTARNAETECISVGWGFSDEADLIESGGEKLARNCRELEAMLLN